MKRMKKIFVVMLFFGILCVFSKAQQKVEPSLQNLTIKDHTLIMKAVLQNRQLLQSKLNISKNKTGNQKISPKKLFSALLSAPNLDENTKSRIKLLLQKLPKFERVIRNISATDKILVEEIRTQIKQSKTIKGKIAILQNLKDKYKNRPIINEGITGAIDMLNDGVGTIYQETPDGGTTDDDNPDGGETDEPDDGEAEVDVVGEDVIGFVVGLIFASPIEGALVGSALAVLH